ncbi:reverse transcriptase [Phytophthora megakarya]|uniref:Reverse transcriptase n=1 Tax=Phytophthora megakarya TaxID=4795 RepID=A0A225VZI5_9STRA|nr:reverse transcriptase [Phytophthora megakarya]
MIYEPNRELSNAQRQKAEVRYKSTADDIDTVTVQEERRRRIAQAQDEELRWSNLKTVLIGETTVMLRLVVSTTMIQEVLHNCHDSIEGGHQGVVRSYHRVKHDYY